MTGIVREESAEYVCIARRNNSLSSSERLLVFGFILFVSLGIAAAFSLIFGAWPILPFAGLEMAVLYGAFRYVDHHASDYERISIHGNTVAVEIQDGRRIERREMNRYWTRVACAEDGSRLALCSHGREIIVGRHVPAEKRIDVARELTRELRGGESGRAR